MKPTVATMNKLLACAQYRYEKIISFVLKKINFLLRAILELQNYCEDSTEDFPIFYLLFPPLFTSYIGIVSLLQFMN